MALPIPPNPISTIDPEAPRIANATPISNTNNPSSSGPAFIAMQKVKTNLVLRSKWAELNGAMGDLGTYIPIVLALTLSRNLNLGTTLIFTGIYNIVTGAIYGVPMPVQPMKSIAAVALADPTFSVPEIMASGILTGAVLLVLGLTGLMQLAYTLIPLSVVRGIQLAQGLSFALTAVKYVRKVQDLPKSKSLEERNWLGRTSRIGRRVKNVVFSLPSAFIVFVLGVILAFVRRPQVVREIKLGPSSIEVVKFTKHVWKEGFVKGTIPQLPLSILNSVIAVCKLTSDLFPGKDFSATSLSVTVGLMNLAGGWFGAMPCCHGAGGLAGQYKFGGRSGGCVAILGAAKLVLGFVLGSSLAHIFNQFPVGILGVLLLFAGIELAMASRDMKNKQDSFVMLICTAVSLVGSSAALGFLSGMLVFLILRLRDWTKGKPLSSFWLRGSPRL
ncbi:hypothetical protein Ahy_A08g040785 [Arachis hypogaea]|uniref:Molybdate transporter n=1 Tax=Arachis hypogaea TaxID=3818 RepID=A0A445C0B5_ARAHY|nr:hypothetical protein Ahy_A08g040785 [Arachis hypogaea]